MSFVACVLLVFVLSSGVAAAQSPDTAEPPLRVSATLTNLTRLESWSFFRPLTDPQTTEPAADPTYIFAGDRALLGARVEARRIDIAAAFNYVRLENLPKNAIGPGALGSGALYFAASGIPYSYQLYLSELNLRAKSSDHRLLVTLGRMKFASGGEVASSNASLEMLKRERLHSRLVGEFESSVYQRRFDGLRIDWDRSDWHTTASVLLPTQGGYEESTNLTMPKVQTANVALTHRGRLSEAQIFGHAYRDRREVGVRPDNSGFPAHAADVSVAALGASRATIVPTRFGELDLVGWFAFELGDWFGQSQRAGSAVAEAGHRWTRSPLRPWLRGGYLWASGDRNPDDDRHGTFFQMLPSSRKYALSTVYTQMNVRDAFAQLFVELDRGVKARVEAHHVDLASAADRWYYGSGATSSTGRFFGFSGRSSGGETSLGTVVEGTVDVPIVRHWSIDAYVGSMWGGKVVRGLFEQGRLTTWYLESVLSF